MSWVSDALLIVLEPLEDVFPRDSSNECGYGPFKPFPPEHPFNRAEACGLHDLEFDLARAKEQGKSLEQVNAELFYHWFLLANNAPVSWEQKNKYFQDICEYWPYCNQYSGVLWKGMTEKQLGEKDETEKETKE